MKTFSAGTKLFCDFCFGGKPKAKCIQVIKGGSGKSSEGDILVELTETVGAYRKGERRNLTANEAVPLKMKLHLKPGQYFTRVSTLYRWE